MKKVQESKETKQDLFFQKKSIEYLAKIDDLQTRLTLTASERSEWKHGVDWTYSAEFQANWTDGGLCKTEINWGFQPYWMKDGGSFGGLFDNLVNYAEEITDMLTHYNAGPTKSNLIRCIHKLQDKVEKDFLNPRSGWTNMKKDLLEKYFKRTNSSCDDD